MIVDPDAVLTRSTATERFEPVSSNRLQIVKAGRGIEAGQAGPCACLDGLEPAAAEPGMKRLGFPAPERYDHLRLEYYVEHSMSKDRWGLRRRTRRRRLSSLVHPAGQRAQKRGERFPLPLHQSERPNFAIEVRVRPAGRTRSVIS